MLSLHLSICSSYVPGCACRLKIVKAKYTIDVNDREFGGIAVHAQLLRSASQHHFVLQLNVGESVFINLPAHSAHDKSVRPSCHRANEVGARNLRFLPFLSVVNLVRVGNFLNMEGVLLPGLLLFLLLQSSELRMLGAVLPIVNDIIASNNNVSLVHGDKLGLDGDVFVLDWAANCVAEDNDPLALSLLNSSDEDAILPASHNLLESSHVLNMLLINDGVPEDNTHVLTLRLLEGENEGVVKV